MVVLIGNLELLFHRHISLALIRQEFDRCHTQRRHLLWTSTSTAPNQVDRTNQHYPPLPPVEVKPPTHTHTHTHTPKVQHRHEKQPKSSPPRHEVCSTQPVKTRDRTQQTTSNQEPNPQIKLPRVCPGFPRREKRIRDPQHFTSHITASLQSPLRHFEHGLRTINQRRHPSKTQRGTGVFFATTAVNESS
jgi:hypothetical protein